ncbi:MAG TPA: pyruvate kinase [Beijerinckiaceae bacterium]|nr:pyruvate kinase [Beijerinckiaceae bacterium]
MRRNRRTKLIATLGPASSDDSTVLALFRAGADVFRINMSHSTHEVLRSRVAQIRAIEAQLARPIGILADLQGPKLRVGRFAAGPVTLVNGAAFRLDSDDAPGSERRVKLPHPEILSSIEKGHRLLLDDGKIQLRVSAVGAGYADTVVEVGGPLSDRKGVSVPDTVIPVGALTSKDYSDLEAAIDAGVDWIALSFVQRPEDIAEVRKITRGRALVMAKIEKPQAIERLEEIMEIADALMVARGDLGVEMPLEVVPGLQKRITRLARKYGKPVVVATQMLESMISAPAPTRAEVSDVATAVFEGADAVMLSAESASGKFPIEAVSTMSRIAESVESDVNYQAVIDGQRAAPEPTGADAIAAAARTVAQTLDLKAIVVWTASGASALRIARERPLTPILMLTTSERTARRMQLVWGIHTMIGRDPTHTADMVRIGTGAARENGFADLGQRIIMVAGVPFGTPGATNMLRIAFVGSGS